MKHTLALHHHLYRRRNQYRRLHHMRVHANDYLFSAVQNLASEQNIAM